MSYVFANGKILESRSASVSIDDRGFLYGDGVFTTMHLCDGCLELFDKHLDRLQSGCKTLGIIPPSIPISLFKELALLNQALEGRWRVKVIVSGGSKPGLSMDLRQGSLYILFHAYVPPAKPFRLMSLFYQPSSLTAEMKTLAYCDRLLLRKGASSAGCDDVLTVDAEGRVGEAACANLLILAGNEVMIPRLPGHMLKGIMIGQIARSLAERGYNVLERPLTLEEIPKESHLYLCNSLLRIWPVESVDSRSFSFCFEKKEAIQSSLLLPYATL